MKFFFPEPWMMLSVRLCGVWEWEEAGQKLQLSDLSLPHEQMGRLAVHLD